MPELLVTRVQNLEVFETTMKELNDECQRAQKMTSEIGAIANVSNEVINDMDVNLASTQAATKRIKQAVAEPIMRDSTASGPIRRDHHEAGWDKKDVLERDTKMKRGDLSQRG